MTKLATKSHQVSQARIHVKLSTYLLLVQVWMVMVWCLLVTSTFLPRNQHSAFTFYATTTFTTQRSRESYREGGRWVAPINSRQVYISYLDIQQL